MDIVLILIILEFKSNTDFRAQLKIVAVDEGF
jgi:hypothetical protein